MSIINELLEGYVEALKSTDAVLRVVAKAPIIHTVVSGDSLWKLQQEYKVPWESIKNYNNLSSIDLHIGQQIEIPPANQDYSNLPKLVDGHPFNLKTEIARAATAQGVDSSLLSALVQTESSGNPDAVSPTGAIGLTQLMPAVVSRLGGTEETVKDPVWNLNAGAKWLSIAIDEAKALKNIENASQKAIMSYALMIYHAGLPAVQKWIDVGSPVQGYGNVGQYTLSYPNKILGIVTQPKK